MNTETVIAICGCLGTVTAGAMAYYERFHNRRDDDIRKLASAKDELVQVLTAESAAYKAASERVGSEFHAYRENAHRQNGESQATILRLTEDNARLKAATDISPLLKHQQEQSEINAKILQGLDLIITRLPHLKQARPKSTRKKP